MESPDSEAGRDRLMGITEIAELAGLSRQAITNLRARDESFPAPLEELRSGPVFRETDIRPYLARRGRLEVPAEPEGARARGPERFDPLALANLARSVERELIDQPPHPLPPEIPFSGGGVYCIYYFGSCAPYAPIASTPLSIPIYAGSAISPRRGDAGLLGPADQPLLFNRLRDHARSLEQATDLRLDDFSCRSLVVDDIWAPVAANLLIYHFRPLWNVVVEGFGLHDPGGARYGSARSSWDELHPGRSWAARLGASRRSRAEILHSVADHLKDLHASDLTGAPHGTSQVPWSS